jgi:hypothetical protein
MGPRVEPDMRCFLLRPFPTSQTYQNLRARPEGVLHVTDDALLLARAAIGRFDRTPAHHGALAVRGFVLDDACCAYEFRVVTFDASEQRVKMECEVAYVHKLRDFFGFNRAKHAVVEAAIFATRVHLLPRDEILAEYAKLDVIVGKTGGEAERTAMEILRAYVTEAAT